LSKNLSKETKNKFQKTGRGPKWITDGKLEEFWKKNVNTSKISIENICNSGFFNCLKIISLHGMYYLQNLLKNVL
jgi:hypothetical protein